MVAWLASANYTARGLVHFSRHHHYHRVKTTWPGPLRLRVYPHPATCTLTDTANLRVCVYIFRLGIFYTFSSLKKVLKKVISLRGRVYSLHLRGMFFFHIFLVTFMYSNVLKVSTERDNRSGLF